jgi:predicted branched-subunit amino acid permease
VGVDGEHRRLVSAGAIQERRAAFRAGQRAILPFVPGSAAWSMIAGVALLKGGLPAGWAIAWSMTVYAASAQLAVLPLLMAGAPLWVLVATGFVTNLRFVIYSAALRPYFAQLPLRKRIALGFLMTDFTFMTFIRNAQEQRLPDKHVDSYFAGMCAVNYVTWQLFFCIGVVAGGYVPTEWGMEFTGTLALIALVGPALNARPAIVGFIVASLVALIAHGLPFKLGIFCGAIAGIVAATLAERWRPPPASAAIQ